MGVPYIRLWEHGHSLQELNATLNKNIASYNVLFLFKLKLKDSYTHHNNNGKSLEELQALGSINWAKKKHWGLTSLGKDSDFFLCFT